MIPFIAQVKTTPLDTHAGIANTFKKTNHAVAAAT